MGDKFLNGYNITNPEIQSEIVLVHLLKKGTITSWESITKYRITRLSAVIYNLRCHFDIESRDTTINGKTFTTYIYIGEIS